MEALKQPDIKLTGGPHGMPRDVVIGIQRDRLLCAMTEVIAEEGYLETTVFKILKRARISRRSYYEIFKDREDCFLAAYDQVAEHVLGLVREACQGSGGSPEERVEAGLAAMLDFAVREPQAARMCVVEVLGAGETARLRRTETMNQLTEMVADALEDICESHEEALLRARVLTGGVHELAFTSLATNRPEQLSGLASQVVASYLPLSQPVLSSH